MARIYYKTVFSGHGGRERGDSIGVTQNSLTTDLVFDCFFEDGETRLFVAGDVVTALFRDVSDGSEYISAGTFTPDIGTNRFTWVQDATDVGTPGDYKIAFEVTGSSPALSILVDYSIEKVPNGTISPMSPLVGVSIEERAWVTVATGWGTEIPLNFNARNQTGSIIPAMRAVMFAGALGASGKALIQLGIADGSLLPSYTMGVTTAEIANGANGDVLWFGRYENADTTGSDFGETWVDGELIYFSSSTSGYLTNTNPTGANRSIEAAVVICAHATQGILLVRPTWHPKVHELDGVAGMPSSTGDLMTWNATGGVFEFLDNVGDFEPELGNPSTDGNVLSSTIVGVRSWVAQAVAAWGSITGDITNQADLIAKLGEYVLKIGDSMTGGLSIAVPTATENALVLQSTDDSQATPLALLKNLSGDTVAKIDPDGVISQYYDPANNPTVRGFLSPRELSLSNSNQFENSRVYTESYDLKFYTRFGLIMYPNGKETLVIGEGSCTIGNNSSNTEVVNRFGSASITLSPAQIKSSKHLFISTVNDTQRLGVYQTLAGGTNPMFEFLVGYFGDTAAEFDHEGDFALGHNRAVANTSHKLQSSTTDGRGAFRQETSWIVNTDASRTAVTKMYISDFAGEHLAIEIQSTGGAVTNIVMPNLPTAVTGLPSGSLWNNSGVMNIA